MRWPPKSLLLASLSKPLLRRRAPLPLLHPLPPRQHLLPFSTRTLSMLPPPDTASTAKPDGLAFLEAGELQESTSDHQKAFDLALKALGPLHESHGGRSLPVARALRLAGAAASRLGLLSDSLESLNAATDIVDSLQGGAAEVAKVGATVHEQLARTKTAMGRRWDAVAHLRRALELKGGFLKEGSAELGDAYRDVAEAYVGLLGFAKALPLCLKAMEIAEKRCGEGTTEVAKVRQLLMVVCAGLGRNEEALEQNELAKMCMIGWGWMLNFLWLKLMVPMCVFCWGDRRRQ